MNSQDQLAAAGLLLFNSGYIYRKLRKEAESAGIRWSALTLLKDIELLAPVTQKALAAENHMSGPSVSVLINQMVEEGLVKRTKNLQDKRSSTLALTSRGQRRLTADGLKLQESLLPLLKQLSDKEALALLRAEYSLSKLFRS